MKKTVIITNVLLSLLILLGDAFYIIYGKLWLKGITSSLFVVMGGLNVFFAIKYKAKNLKFCSLLLTGLIFAMLGDIVLNIYFIGGAILFAIGHIFFFVSYCSIAKLNWKDLIFGLAIFVPSCLFITLAPIFDFGGILMETVCIVYALIISFMVGKAFSNWIACKTLLSVLIFIGSVLFFFSDLMLLLNVFASLSRVFEVLCLATYYPAEIVLAVSILFSSEFRIKEKI